jgi:hypothetical protein
MIPEATASVPRERIPAVYDDRFLPSLCWGAIVGGTVAAIGIHILLTVLGIGAGLATFSPLTDSNPLDDFGGGAAFIWSLCALVSLFFGALVAGRFSHSWHSGFVHGILVWSLTLVITLLLLSKGMGMALGGGLKVLGAGLGISASGIAPGAGEMAKEELRRTGDELASFVDEAVTSIPTNAAPKAYIRAKREVGLAVAQLFAPENDLNSAPNRAAAIKALIDYTQMSPTDAAMTVDGWIASYKTMKMELDHARTVAEQKARDTADRAAHSLSHAAGTTFFALLIGLVVSAVGGSVGARCAVKNREFSRGMVK